LNYSELFPNRQDSVFEKSLIFPGHSSNPSGGNNARRESLMIGGVLLKPGSFNLFQAGGQDSRSVPNLGGSGFSWPCYEKTNTWSAGAMK
jgi:hypothetical protein